MGIPLQNGSVVTVRDLVLGNCSDAATGLPIEFKLSENGLSGTASFNDETDPKNKRARGYSFDLSMLQVPVTMTDEEIPEQKSELKTEQKVEAKPAPAPTKK